MAIWFPDFTIGGGITFGERRASAVRNVPRTFRVYFPTATMEINK